MKYAILVGDGMADYPVPKLQDKTPLEYARTPNMDLIAREGKGGTVITVPRILADCVVTECGVAMLKGKTQRQRAVELIKIAHPDFREELEKEAKRMFWP